MYYTYILSNAWRTTLYIGITHDIWRRVDEHRQGIGGAFTKKYKLHDLVHLEEYDDVTDAIRREKELKGWRRSKKNTLIVLANPTWSDLSTMLI